MDGSRRPASELAAIAGVRPPAASEHLAVLVGTGIVAAEASGRRRFYRIADPAIANALEALGRVTGELPSTGYTRSREASALAEARLCYDHLAGRLGVGLFDAMTERGWLGEGGAVVTEEGRAGFADLGIPLEARGSRRPVARPCADWTERRSHLAGIAGRALAETFLERGWVQRRPSSRGLRVTEAGATELDERWGVGVGVGERASA